MPLPALLLAAALTTADEPPARHPIAVALLAGAGINDSNAGSGDAMNLYGPGAGIRAGYTFRIPFYAGASFLYHLGFSRDLGDGRHGSGRLSPLGFEGGYDLTFGRVAVRPYVGAGVVLYEAAYTGVPDPTQGTGKKLAFWPGIVATVDATEHLFAGLDARYTIVSSGADATFVAAGGGSANALGFYADVGWRF